MWDIFFLFFDFLTIYLEFLRMQLQTFFGLIKLCKKPRGSMTTIVLTSSNHKNINHDNRSIAEHNGDIFLTIGVPNY